MLSYTGEENLGDFFGYYLQQRAGEEAFREQMLEVIEAARQRALDEKYTFNLQVQSKYLG